MVELLVSEVVTNAQAHGRTDCSMRIESTGGSRVRVEVVSGGLGPKGRSSARSEDPTDEEYALVAALACRWGFVPVATGGRLVWFEVGSEGSGEESLVDVLVQTALTAASLLKTERPSSSMMTKRLMEIADGDMATLQAAWRQCVDAFTDDGARSWLLAATYLIPPMLQHHGFDTARVRYPRD